MVCYTLPPLASDLRAPVQTSRRFGCLGYYWHLALKLVHSLAGIVETGARVHIAADSVSWHMTSDSSPRTPEARGASRTDKNDELDANIRNFAPVARIMKNALPDNAKIAKEAKECMQECVSEFISFITSEGKSPTLTGVVLCAQFAPVASLLGGNTLQTYKCNTDRLTARSFGEMPPGEAENRQRRRHSLRHDVSRV